MVSPDPPSVLSVGGWSAAVGANQSKIVDLMVSSVANALAVTGMVLLFAAEPQLPRAAGGLLAALAVGLVGWLMHREVARQGSLLTVYAGSRLVLLVAVAAALLSRAPGQAKWIWLATGVALLAVLAEPMIKVLLSKTEQVAVSLPGVRSVPAPPCSPNLLPIASMVVVVLGGVLAVVAAPAWLYLAVALLAALAVSIMIGHAARANLISRRSMAGLPKALMKYRPEFAVYYGGLHGARYQLGMWLPYLERLGRPFVVITREAATVPVITALTTAPVVVPRTTSALGDLEELVPPSMRAAFYVQGSRANLSFQRFRRLTHVWLNHGDSDKAANFSARHATYDKVLVCGQQGVERYAAHGVRIPPEQMIMVGRPQVERIEVRDAPPAPEAARTVLYAPTWRGGRPATDYSSLRLGGRIVEALLDRGATVIFRPHPLSHADPADAGLIRGIQQRLDAAARQTGRAHVWGRRAERDWDVADCVNAADGLITDVSSVAADNLASGKPFAMVAIRSAGDAFRREFPMARVAYVIEKDLSTLDEALDQLLGDDVLAERRRAYRSYCLGDRLGAQAAEEFLRVAGEIVAGTGDNPARKSRRKPGSASAPRIEDTLFGGDPDVADLVSQDAERLGERARPGEIA